MNLAETTFEFAIPVPSTLKLSEHFAASELSCRHCGHLFITPALIVMLEKLRSLVGEPLTIASGYRCPTHNRNIRGATKSKHCLGMAVDILVPDKYRDNPAEFIEAAEAVAREVRGGYHYYPGSHFIHMDCWVWPPDRRW